ncbi:hypothetical protein Oter_4520 [Opitutus terrae PB90-1]|uniref:DUF2961 domain-containing protein n=2 Tax=Opitutus terrae TaxID=107709 RepID=B1ZQ70_OPITP|nr:hypothetical protein Oter_4520 [Opitutus terrae PB90-1]
MFPLLIAWLLTSAAMLGAEEIRDVSWFLQRMRSVEHLAELENSHTALASTWDRTGANGDGGDFKDLRPPTATEPGRNILLDVDGPGCIHRIFLGVLGPQQQGTRIQIFLDGLSAPTIDLPITEFFDYQNGPLPYPLVFFKSYPGTLFPIPFAQHCLVQLVNADYGKPDWNDARWSNYWQITYTRYSESVKVKSLTWPLSEAEKREALATREAWLLAESSAPLPPAQWDAEHSTALAPHETLSFDLPGTGVIRQLRVQLEPATPQVLEAVRLQLTWDGAAEPSVDVPVGYFFGHVHGGLGQVLQSPAAVNGPSGPLHPDNWDLVPYSTTFHSLLLGTTDREAYACFPMPFAHGARVKLVNTGDVAVSLARVRLQLERREKLPPDWGRFHATWTHSLADTADTPRVGPKQVPVKTVLQRSGAGKYVGVMLSIDWPSYAWWGEGDWLIWSDEAGWPPSYHGTGSEEYFNSGWCRFDRKAVSGFVTLRPGHPTVYSFHLNDAFQFRKSIRVVEEQMGHKLIGEGHPRWINTAFWYGREPQPAGSD